MVTNLPQKNAFVSLIVNIIRKSFKTRTNRYITKNCPFAFSETAYGQIFIFFKLAILFGVYGEIPTPILPFFLSLSIIPHYTIYQSTSMSRISDSARFVDTLKGIIDSPVLSTVQFCQQSSFVDISVVSTIQFRRIHKRCLNL